MLKEIEEAIPDYVQATGKSLEGVTRTAQQLSSLLETAIAHGRKCAQEGRNALTIDSYARIAAYIFNENPQGMAQLLHKYFMQGYNEGRVSHE